MADEAISKYFEHQNRPFSSNDVIQKFEKEFGKASVLKTLDNLVRKKKIFEKLYGKQKLYCAIQSEDEPPDVVQEQIAKLDQSIREMSTEIAQLTDQLHSTESQIRMLSSSLTTEEAVAEKNALEEKIARLEEKLEKLSSNSVAPVDPAEKAKVEGEYKKLAKEYRKRKRICVDIINAICEGYPKSKRELMEEIGVETDESVGFTFKEY